MNRKHRNRRLAVVLVFGLVAATPALAIFGFGFGGGRIVFDPANYLENVRQVAALLQQMLRAGRQIELQWQQLAHLPESVANDLSASAERVQTRWEATIADAIPDAAAIAARLEEEFPVAVARVDLEWFARQRETAPQTARTSLQQRRDQQEAVREAMVDTTAQLERIVRASNGEELPPAARPGLTAVGQARAELVAIAIDATAQYLSLRSARVEQKLAERATAQSRAAQQQAAHAQLWRNWPQPRDRYGRFNTFNP